MVGWWFNCRQCVELFRGILNRRSMGGILYRRKDLIIDMALQFCLIIFSFLFCRGGLTILEHTSVVRL